MFGVTAFRLGALGLVELSRSADPDFDVEARFPCLLSKSNEDARMDDVVEILKV